jgi:K+-sensing histidine kinase KdpD
MPPTTTTPHHYKKAVISTLVILAVAVLIVVLVAFYAKRSKDAAERQRKIDILQELNESAKNAPPVSDKQKEAIIKQMSAGENKQLTAEEKAAIILAQTN